MTHTAKAGGLKLQQGSLRNLIFKSLLLKKHFLLVATPLLIITRLITAIVKGERGRATFKVQQRSIQGTHEAEALPR